MSKIRNKIIYQILKALALLSMGANLAILCDNLGLPLWVLFCACLICGGFLDWFFFSKIEDKKGWSLWKRK